MSDPQSDQLPHKRVSPWGGRLTFVIALLALAAASAPWLGITSDRDFERTLREESAKTLRRVNALEDRIQRERDDLSRLVTKLGTENQAEDSLTGRVTKLENAFATLPGVGRVRSIWLLEQAEYFLRVANAQESLAGDSDSALTALEMADEHLRDTGDPRLTPVRKLVAAEMAALRALPRVDTEGLVLKLGTLTDSLSSLPRKQAAPPGFKPEPEATTATGGLERVAEALRNAILSVVSLRRTGAPAATLLSDESASLLMRSLDLELQMGRLALLRGEGTMFRASLAAVRRNIEAYFDTESPLVGSALATLDDLAHAPLRESRPDVSASLAALLKLREAGAEP